MDKIESYEKVIHITLDTSGVDKKVADVSKKFSDFEKVAKDKTTSAFFNTKEMDALNKEYEELFKKEEKIAKLEETINDLKKLDSDLAKQKTKELEKQLKMLKRSDKYKENKQEYKEQFLKKAKNLAELGFKKLSDTFLNGAMTLEEYIGKAFSNAWSELQEMASYSSSTYMFNQKKIDDAFNYGFNSAQSYAYNKVSGMTGWDVENLLTYGDEHQQKKFVEMMTKYAERYTDLEQSGFFDTLNDFQIEMLDMKEEFTYEVAEFFVDNKDTIKQFMKTGLSFMEFMVKAVATIGKVFGVDGTMSSSEKSAAVSDIISNYTTNANKTLNYTDNSNNYYGQSGGLANNQEISVKLVHSFLNS